MGEFAPFIKLKDYNYLEYRVTFYEWSAMKNQLIRIFAYLAIFSLLLQTSPIQAFPKEQDTKNLKAEMDNQEEALEQDVDSTQERNDRRFDPTGKREYIPPTEYELALTSEQVRSFDCSMVSDVPPVECEALVDLYESTNGAGWTNKTNWLVTYTVDDWYGIVVSTGHVTDIELYGNQLTGVLPSTIGNLRYLRDIYLSANQITGQIPVEIGNFINLETIYLGGNLITGSIPSSIGGLSNLHWIELTDNQISGSMPYALSFLANLSGLRLSSNLLTGTLPTWLGNLSNLGELSLAGNQFTGSIPPELGKLSKLDWLEINANQLTGDVPTELGNLTNLIKLHIGLNQLSGSVPLTFVKLTKLEDFFFRDTNLCEPINPDFLAWKATVPIWRGSGIVCPTTSYSISGQVTDDSGQPLEGVNILCNGQNYDKLVTTGADGTYYCNNLPPGMYLVEHPDSVLQSGRDISSLWPSVYGWYFLDSDKTQQNFRLAYSSGTYYGVVKEFLTNIPIANATIKLGGAQPVKTDNSGNYSISVMPGYYVMTVSSPGYLTNQQIVHVSNLLVLEKNISLLPYRTDVYRLPYPATMYQSCTQGNFGSTSHKGIGKYAFDFGASYNEKYKKTPITTVSAVREGKVIQVKTDGVPAGLTDGCGSKGNYVLIKHPDGRASLYLHLKSVFVKAGDRVASGQPIGIAGNTGCSTGIHLHFQLEEYIKGRWWTQSVPIKFYDVNYNYLWSSTLKNYYVESPSNGVPKSGYFYKSANIFPLTLDEELVSSSEERITDDTISPVGSAFFKLTNSPEYIVELNAFDYESENLEMRIARSLEGLDLLPWIPFAEEINWDYPMIYVQYRDEVGNVSETYSAFVESTGYEQPVLELATNELVCTNQDIGLINQTTPYCEQCNWLWDFGDGQLSSDMEPYFDDTWEGGFRGYSNPGEYTISVNMITATGQYSTSKIIEVFQTPDNGFTISRSGLTVNLASVDETAQSWIWDFGDGTIENSRIASHTYNSQDDFPFYITLEVISENGCRNINYFEIPVDINVFLPLIIRE